MTAPTRKEIEAARTPNGGYTAETLAAWGVPWPPPKGWKRELLGLRKRGTPYQRSLADRRCANKACARMKDGQKAFCRACAAAFLMGLAAGKIEILREDRATAMAS